MADDPRDLIDWSAGTGTVKRADWGRPYIDDSRSTGVMPDNGMGRTTAPLPEPAPNAERPKPAEAPSTTTVTAEKVAAASDGEADADALAGIDAEDQAKYHRLLKDGIYSGEELARHYGLTPAEVAALQSMKAPPAAESLPQDLAAVEAELAAIADLRKADRAAYNRDTKLQSLERDLIEQRAELQKAAAWQEQARAKTEAVIEKVEDAAAFESGFTGVFNSLSEHGRDVVTWHLGQPPADSTLRASDDELVRLSALGPNCASVIKSWGREASRKAANAEAALTEMLDAMSAADRAKAEKYLKSQSDAAKAAIIGMLAG